MNALQRRYVHGPGLDEHLAWYEGAGTSDRRHLIQDDLASIIANDTGSGPRAADHAGRAEAGDDAPPSSQKVTACLR